MSILAQELPTHIVLRYADNFAGVKDTIKAHNEIAQRTGYVWFGKLGRKALSYSLIAQLNARCKKRNGPLLYTVKCYKGRFTTHVSKILAITRTRPHDSSNIPSYYPKGNQFSLWFRIKPLKQIESHVLLSLVVISSGGTVSNALGYSMAPYFIVTEDKHKLAEILSYKSKHGTFPEIRSAKKGKTLGRRNHSREDLIQEDPNISKEDLDLIDSFED